MTEEEWLNCTDPIAMLAFLRGRASERKLRLFACACCRQVWHLLIDERSRLAVEAAERFADGLLADSEAQEAFTAACAASLAVRRSPDASSETILRLRRQHEPDTLWRAAFMAAFAVGSGVGDVQAHIRGAAAGLVGGPMRSRFLSDLFGPLPFRPVTADPLWLAWNDSTAVNMAQGIYDERAFDRLPILADALEESGCDNADILQHCRHPVEHVRGCWPLDLLLGKS